MNISNKGGYCHLPATWHALLSRLGYLECLKYNGVDFCLNYQSTHPLITKMNNSKTPDHAYNRYSSDT